MVRKMLLLASIAISGCISAAPIHEAVANGNLDKVKEIVKSNPAAADSLSDLGFTPLFIAARNGAYDIASYLVAHGANPNKAPENFDPIQIAKQLKAQEGNSYHYEDEMGSTGAIPLLGALYNYHFDIAKLLLKHGADPNKQALGNGKTALHIVVSRKIQGPPEQEDREAQRKHIREIIQTRIELLDTLLDYGADPNIIDKKSTGYAPLHLVAIPTIGLSRPEIVRKLINAGASVNIQALGGFFTSATPLHFALIGEFHSKPMAELLIEHGADPNILIEDIGTILHMVVNFPERVQFLLENKADPNVQNEDGETPLLFATLVQNIDSISYLLKHGADPTIADKRGVTPLDIAAGSNPLERGGEQGTFEFLIGKISEDPDTAAQIMDLFLEKVKADEHATLLHTAVQNDYKPAVETLLKHGYDPNKQAPQALRNIPLGATPLYIAAREGHKDIVRLLLKHNADPSIQTKDGKTPLYIAKKHDHEEIVKILQQTTNEKKGT